MGTLDTRPVAEALRAFGHDVTDAALEAAYLYELCWEQHICRTED
jgi:hypothetical protein